MSRRYKSLLMHELAERRYPCRVDIVVPPFGLGQRLDAMTERCRASFAAKTWEEHGHRERPGTALTPIDYARFYFESQDAERAFRSKWGSIENESSNCADGSFHSCCQQ
ncbi:MAG: hypothetical protein WAM62_07695 [Pseudolabrys sp.]